MPDITLVAELGRPLGSRSSGRLRAAGKIPGVVYGHGNDPVPVAVDARELRAVLNTEAGLNALITLDLGGKTTLAMAKDIQRHPTRHTVSHIDFLVVSRDEVISADIPVTLVGEAEEVLKADGVVDQQLFTLTVHTKPGDIPNAIEVDVTGLAVGTTVRVGDLTLPAGVSTDVDPETAVVVGQPPQVTAADLVTEEQAEEAAVAAAEDAGEEAPAAGGASSEGAEDGSAGGEAPAGE